MAAGAGNGRAYRTLIACLSHADCLLDLLEQILDVAIPIGFIDHDGTLFIGVKQQDARAVVFQTRKHGRLSLVLAQ